MGDKKKLKIGHKTFEDKKIPSHSVLEKRTTVNREKGLYNLNENIYKLLWRITFKSHDQPIAPLITALRTTTYRDRPEATPPPPPSSITTRSL